MRRREFIALVAATTFYYQLNLRAQRSDLPRSWLTASDAVAAQDRARPWRIGFLEAGSLSAHGDWLAAFRRGLAELGYVEGRDIVIEDRWAEYHLERFAPLVAELIERAVDAIVVTSNQGALAGEKATMTIPIVFALVSDPVATGLVAQFNRPGGNATGFTNIPGEGFAGKWVQFLKEAAPETARVAVFWNPAAQLPRWKGLQRELEEAARAYQVEIEPFEVGNLSQLEGAFAAMPGMRIDGLILPADVFMVGQRDRVVALAAEHRLPAVYSMSEFVEAGGLMSYAVDEADVCRRAASYVDKILRGEKPGDLPVQDPTKFNLLVNLKTAKALGLTVPLTLLGRADEVIE